MYKIVHDVLTVFWYTMCLRKPLNAHPEDLDDHLRHAVSLLKANDQPFDWFQFFEDLMRWDHPEGFAQLQWARDFYKGTRDQTDVPTDTHNKKETDNE